MCSKSQAVNSSLNLSLLTTCRMQQRAEQWQREAGLLPPEPQSIVYQSMKAEPVSEPRLLSTVQGDPEAFMTLNLSRNLGQSMNPGYQLRDGFQQESCMKSDFVWDQDEVLRADHIHKCASIHEPCHTLA